VKQLVFMTLALTVFVCGFSLSFPIHSAQACPIVRPPNTNYHWFDGWWQLRNETVYGVQSYVEEWDPFTSTNGMSSAWVMLSDNAGRLVQIGWYEFRNSVWSTGHRYNFVAYTEGSTTNINLLLFPETAQIGSQIWYEVHYQGNSHFETDMGNQLFWYMDSTFVPRKAFISGEISNLASQMPGAQQDHATMTVGLFETGPGTIHYFDTPDPATRILSPSGYGNEFAYATSGSWTIDIWDRKCIS
jgi:hypothetical protein